MKIRYTLLHKNVKVDDERCRLAFHEGKRIMAPSFEQSVDVLMRHLRQLPVPADNLISYVRLDEVLLNDRADMDALITYLQRIRVLMPDGLPPSKPLPPENIIPPNLW